MTLKDEGRDCFRTEGDEDSLLTNSELSVGAVSSILQDSDLKRADAMSIEEALALSLQGAAAVCPDAFICLFHYCFKLSINFISFLQMATYMKSLARRANFAEGSTRAMKVYKVKVASLTSKKADLRARMQRLAEDAVKYESDLKHTTIVKARAEDKANKARDELRVAEDELRAVRDEVQVARDELHVVRDELLIKATTLSRVSQEASKAMSSMERLTKEFHELCRDLQRQEALVNQKEGVIAELRDEACTLWPSRWLAFRCKAAKVFPGLDFNFQVPTKGEAEESNSDDEADPVVFLDAPNSVLFPGEPEIEAPTEASSPTSVAGTSPSNLHGSEVRVTEAAHNPALDI